MFEKIKEMVKKQTGKYSKMDLGILLYKVNHYADQVLNSLGNISAAQRISTMDENTANKLIRRLRLQSEDARLKAVGYIDKNEELPLPEEQKKRNRELFHKHFGEWVSKSNQVELVESIRKDYLGFVSRRLERYQSSRKKLEDYEKQHDDLVEAADEFPTLKAKIANIDIKLANIETYERDIFSNPQILMLLSKEEQERLREKYKFGENLEKVK